ncbi:MAG: lipoyl(octanoyl) transferase LipB [Alphaproteobacteria bacterium]|jgi:lipoyl(octanoyl) transferase|nr:lipoyl(octanoyl) transferase LipB [Alphaproteobacteria bacterium]QQS58611.1 MAG: lipoyl(octanoyl) transferase LipB [Alphaproteobacteria bacterium]
MVEWKTEKTPVDYPFAVSEMERRVEAIRAGTEDELVWLLEHPPLYTAGTSAKAKDLLNPRFPVYETGRGGEYTYHGPGQRVAYVMLDLRKRGPDVRAYVCALEDWIIRSLAHFDVKGERREGRIGIWIDLSRHGGLAGQEAKIAAIGIRIRRWVTYHGVAVNINPDLSHFGGIVPCGIAEHGVTSLAALGIDCKMSEFDRVMKSEFEKKFQGGCPP